MRLGAPASLLAASHVRAKQFHSTIRASVAGTGMASSDGATKPGGPASPTPAQLPKAAAGSLASLEAHASHSWLEQLNPDPATSQNIPNRSSRQVRSGHYVEVKPTPLLNPELVAVSREMAQELGLSEAGTQASDFVRFFSGDTSLAPKFRSWATPYALSIYGSEMIRNCPFGTGNGYGDGRAISVAEVLVPASVSVVSAASASAVSGVSNPLGSTVSRVSNDEREEGEWQDEEGDEEISEEGKTHRRWELQLKGAGPTPFCRGADGRAVLRSSVREFLVSEAMYHLGVSTTRALCLVRSIDVAMRPWYSGQPVDDSDLPGLDDPRIAHLPLSTRQQILSQLRSERSGPDVMRPEPIAITCRVAPSFIRVGHLELFARRVRNKRSAARNADEEVAQLERLFNHLLFREYPELLPPATAASPEARRSLVLAVLQAFSGRLAQLTADWVRVGYVQGNFNSDNCLVAGRTMDYGPFGFIERFTPLWNMWSGGGEHFGFLNQPAAGQKNFGSLASALVELLPQDDRQGREKATRLVQEHTDKAQSALNQVWRLKLGLASWEESDQKLISGCLELLEETQADWTLFWRQLALLPEQFLSDTSTGLSSEASSDEALLAPFQHTFYQESLTQTQRKAWAGWLRGWLARLQRPGPKRKGKDISAAMRRASPKYVPREWMLVKAYSDAMERKDYGALRELQDLFRHPYEEQTQDLENKYYRRAPAEVYAGAGLGGVAHMT
eukprot:gb/GEZN01001891.1/.p1 GENE.gb/GEZN01001891.1/~~gb/GEZN01001891.1/.p1  ORF type:complete len:743 (+),score=117.51 gb/GEZN01001891.1/:38-2230(+)